MFEKIALFHCMNPKFLELFGIIVGTRVPLQHYEQIRASAQWRLYNGFNFEYKELDSSFLFLRVSLTVFWGGGGGVGRVLTRNCSYQNSALH